LSADLVLLLIEHLLLTLADTAAIDSGHVALLLANRVAFPVQLAGLMFADLAFLQFTIDPAVLVCKPVIDLIAARVVGSHCVSAKAAVMLPPTRANEITKTTDLRKARMIFSSLSGWRNTRLICTIQVCQANAELAVRCAFNSGSSEGQICEGLDEVSSPVDVTVNMPQVSG